MITVKNLYYSYGKDPIFLGVDFVVSKGQRVGLVGQNGSGKSTLFKLICGKESPSSGRVEVLGKVMMVPQEVKYDEDMEKSQSIRHYLDPKNQKEDYELRRILGGLELAQISMQSSPLILSGGQKTKLAIARALIQSPQILLLDEPTNFLDISGKKWVMNFLGRYPHTLMIVSHDLSLLGTNIDKILDINIQTKKIDEYSGNYQSFEKLKKEKEELMKRTAVAAQKHLNQMKSGLEKMSHLKSEKGVRQRLNLQRRIEKMEENLPPMPIEAKQFKVKIPDPTWVGSVPVIVKNIHKSFADKKVLDNVNFEIFRGERVGLIGQNGAGKSTLIKIITGRLEPDNGEVILDQKLDIGYYSQEFESYDPDSTLMETVRQKCQSPEQLSRSLLGRFLFTGDRVDQKVGTLSGGEKTRLSIAVLLAKSHNLLILDEPTTYLDVLSQRLILEALKDYFGAILIVSHNPQFLDELKLSRKFYLPENRIELLKNSI